MGTGEEPITASNESILKSVKLSLNVPSTETAFDVELIMHLNSALSVLTQLGIGPEDGFEVVDETQTWAMLLGNEKRISLVKTYCVLKTRIVFDPPTVAAVLESLNREIKELEWRIEQTMGSVRRSTETIP